MRQFLYLLVVGLELVVLFFVHIMVVTLLPHPLSEIHTVMLFLMWLSIFPRRLPLWPVAFILALFLELFSSTYFGVHVVAMIASLVALQWVLHKVFTNHSWYMVGVSGFGAFFVYRLVVQGLYFLGHLDAGVSVYFSVRALLDILTDAGVNALALIALYSIVRVFLRQFNPRYLTQPRFTL